MDDYAEYSLEGDVDDIESKDAQIRWLARRVDQLWQQREAMLRLLADIRRGSAMMPKQGHVVDAILEAAKRSRG